MKSRISALFNIFKGLETQVLLKQNVAQFNRLEMFHIFQIVKLGNKTVLSYLGFMGKYN